ncbi:MAG TPA: hypothetical protein VIO37_11325 [Candidatus Dormibacteraeota bacterium]|jgi:hypothetical protein
MATVVADMSMSLDGFIRFFDHLRDTPVMLEDPEVTKGFRVTHLEYRVRPQGVKSKS